jgi:bacillithiol biosynthesis cysteine-adding enzyme BshC
MKILQYPRNKINYYNQIQLDLVENQQNLSEFIGLPFSEKSIQEQITLKIKEYSNHHRVVLNSVLIEQYKGTETTPEVIENIKRLKQDNTFTITTGHQLTLFGGPAYFFYKIIHAISLSKSLNDKFTDYHFVPVFWMASEDHDKDEISETTIFNDQFKWESDNAGPTGAFKLDRNFEEIKLRFIELFSNAEYDSVKKHIESFDGKNLSESFFKYLNSIFKKYGLIILEPNNSVLKNFLIPILENELENFTSYHKVNKTNEELSSRNIPVQAKVQLVNFFYLSENKRSKIYFVDNLFQIESKKYSKSELIELIRRNPENFSPNVFLRPLYQELILPNIAYIGGPGELSYWIQLKGIFSFYQVTYPLLTNRISVFFIDKNLKKKI